MDNYRFYLSARVQCYRVRSLGASFDSGVDIDVCTSWYGVTNVLCLPSSSKCGVGSILLSVFVLVDLGPSLQKSSIFLKICPAHRDKTKIKCMGPVGGKHQQNQIYIYSLLSLSIGSKTKLMGGKFMSVAFKTFVRSVRSNLWKDNLSMYMYFSLYLSKDWMCKILAHMIGSVGSWK